MRLFDKTLSTLEDALDARLLRHNLLAGDLANADTPGFVPRDLDFGKAMAEAAAAREAPPAPEGDIPLSASGAPAALAATVPLTEGTSSGAGIDGNAVDVDRTLAALAANAIQYGAAARAAGKKLAILRYVASDGTA